MQGNDGNLKLAVDSTPLISLNPVATIPTMQSWKDVCVAGEKAEARFGGWAPILIPEVLIYASGTIFEPPAATTK